MSPPSNQHSWRNFRNWKRTIHENDQNENKIEYIYVSRKTQISTIYRCNRCVPIKTWTTYPSNTHNRHVFEGMIPYRRRQMNVMESRITSQSSVVQAFCLKWQRRNIEGSSYCLFVKGIHRWPVVSPHRNMGNVSVWWRHNVCYRLVTLRSNQCRKLVTQLLYSAISDRCHVPSLPSFSKGCYLSTQVRYQELEYGNPHRSANDITSKFSTMPEWGKAQNVYLRVFRVYSANSNSRYFFHAWVLTVGTFWERGKPQNITLGRVIMGNFCTCHHPWVLFVWMLLNVTFNYLTYQFKVSTAFILVYLRLHPPPTPKDGFAPIPCLRIPDRTCHWTTLHRDWIFN